jgi:hypothetical protein
MVAIIIWSSSYFQFEQQNIYPEGTIGSLLSFSWQITSLNDVVYLPSIECSGFGSVHRTLPIRRESQTRSWLSLSLV